MIEATWIDETLLVRLGSRELRLPPMSRLNLDVDEVAAALRVREGLHGAANALNTRFAEIRGSKLLTDNERARLRRAAADKALQKVDEHAKALEAARAKLSEREGTLKVAVDDLKKDDSAGALLDSQMLQRVEQMNPARRRALVAGIESGEPSAIRAGEAMLRLRAVSDIPGDYIKEAHDALFEWRNAAVIPKIRDATVAISRVAAAIEEAQKLIREEVAHDQSALAA